MKLFHHGEIKLLELEKSDCRKNNKRNTNEDIFVVAQEINYSIK